MFSIIPIIIYVLISELIPALINGSGGDYYDYQVKNGQGYEIELSIKNNNVQLEKLTPIAMEEAEEKDK